MAKKAKKKSKRIKSKKKPQTKSRGRSTKYEPRYCDEIIEFFNQEPYDIVKLPHYQKDGKTLKWTDYKREPKKLPTLIQFANHIGVCIKTIYNWIDNKSGSYQDEFLRAFTCAKKLQKDFLIQAALMGLYNPIFAKFTAINLTDMRDLQEHIIDDQTEEEKLEIQDIKERLKDLENAGNGLATD